MAIYGISSQAGKLGAPDWRSAKYRPEFFLLHFGQPVERGIDQAFARFEFWRGRRLAPCGSTGKRPGRCRSRRRGVPCLSAIRLESRRAFRWSGRRCTGGRPVRRARQSPALDRRRCSGCRCRSDRAREGRPRVLLESVGIERGKDHAQKQPRSKLLIDDAGVFADPSDCQRIWHRRARSAGRCRHRSGSASCQYPVASCQCLSSSPRNSFSTWLQAAHDGLMIILARPGVARDPALARLFRSYLSRVRMRGVVVDGAHDHAARPGSDSGERRALEFAGVIARFHVLHFAVLSRRRSNRERRCSSPKSRTGAMPQRSNPALRTHCLMRVGRSENKLAAARGELAAG